MLIEQAVDKRSFRANEIAAQLVVVGGGIAGVFAAVAAAREGLKVVLAQDRPVLGGNASSEVRLWMLGATSHLGNNNRWAREGGLVDEILVENMYRNPEGNAVLFDAVLLDLVTRESNITLLLNTAVFEVEKEQADTIKSVVAFCSQNQTMYHLSAPLFVDASGDGVVGFLAGAAFRMGAEPADEFGEKFAPSKAYGELLGHSLYFYSKDAGKPVTFIPPSFALDDITKIPRYRSFNSKDNGCRLWWIEYGGRLDTVHDTETIKWELWKVVYGVWNYIKNSGKFPEAENLTLEWVGTIPGKRESRRFEGDYILKQQDIVEQRCHADAVGYGGWSIDLHPADGVFSEKPGCNQWHSKGIYQIPYRCLYSRNISNLFLAGRIISASHVAFGSSRVMATCGLMAQAVGTAAALCTTQKLSPRDLLHPDRMHSLQQTLLQRGVHIPGVAYTGTHDLVQRARLSASSELVLSVLKESAIKRPLLQSVAQMLPLPAGKMPVINLHATAGADTVLEAELRISLSPANYTPEVILEQKQLPLHPGRNCLRIEFETALPAACYANIVFRKNPDVQLHYSDQRITGILTVFNRVDASVSNYGRQTATEDIGVDSFEFWCPVRRPEGHNVALALDSPVQAFGVEHIRNGINRPTIQPNAWVAGFADEAPCVTMEWDTEQTIGSLELAFDTDFDHPMESVLMGHPERVMPFCVRNYTIEDAWGRVLYTKQGNYATRNRIVFSEAVKTNKLLVRCEHPAPEVPAAIFSIRCFE